VKFGPFFAVLGNAQATLRFGAVKAQAGLSLKLAWWALDVVAPGPQKEE